MMRASGHLYLAVICLTVAVGPRAVRAQQDGLVALPNVYRVQFENAWVRVVHAHIPAKADLPYHNHPPGVMVHVYLTDANPILFEHDGSPNSVTRPYVYARSYRVGRARPETHAVVNRFPDESDYLRVEFKTQGDAAFGQRIAAPPLGSATKSTIEVANAMYRVSRLTIAARDSFVVSADSGRPALLIALTEGVPSMKLGGERFIDAGRREAIRNARDASVELLRVDFLTQPAPPP